jgi:hypothetical protein
MKIAFFYFIEDHNRLDEHSQQDLKEILKVDVLITSQACNVLENTQYPYFSISEFD